MNRFNYQYPVKQYFGKGCAEEALKKEMPAMDNVMMLAYGGGQQRTYARLLQEVYPLRDL